MKKRSWQQGTTEKEGLKNSKCKSVCRTGKLSTASRGQENHGTVHGSKKRGSHAELGGG